MIKRAITYFFIVTLSLYAIRYLHYKGLWCQHTGYYGKLNTMFVQSNNYNVLFLGSSRAEMHYDTRIFDSVTGKNSFNIGLSGAMPDVAFAALKAYLYKSTLPEHIIYEVDFHVLNVYEKRIVNFNNYMPFLSHPVLRQEFTKIDGRMNQFYYNPFFSLPFTGLKNISTGIHGWLKIPSKTDSLYYKGHYAEVFNKSLDFISTPPVRGFIHPVNRAYMDSLILFCQLKKIKLTWITSPIFAGGEVNMCNKKEVLTQVKNIAKINHIPYFDYSAMPICKERSLFYDHQHLKQSGSKQFSLKMAALFNNKKEIFPLKVSE